jgi:hypothetical protein
MPTDSHDPPPAFTEAQGRATAEAHLREIGDHHCQLYPGTLSKLPGPVYGPLPDEPSWAFHVDPWTKRGTLALDSTRFILVSKLSGRVILDATASDEG